ncbi:hypothetical protein FQA47_017008 [Oryzias melastigma]|uniref:Uncharacterized protein n=1 Tax=Oryzias melastigma TaxID=30732 RepID=A0A834BXT4_ORYME|nr:hypothetical protein FQA47_017008 [Oryzias melastigma]
MAAERLPTQNGGRSMRSADVLNIPSKDEEGKEPGRARPGNELEMMDLFDIRLQSGQPTPGGTRPNCS